MRRACIRVSVAITMLMPLPGGADAVPADEVPLTLHHTGHITVDISASGEGPFRFLVDTGSSASSVFEPLAKRLRLSPASRIEVVTAIGTELRAVVSLGPIRVGRAEVPSIQATLLTYRERRNLGLDVDGILGQDFLSQFHYTIDYRRRRLIWEDDWAVTDPGPGAAPRASARVRLLEAEGRSIVELPQGARGEPPLRFVADTGTSTFVVFEGTSGMSVPMIAGNSGSEAASILGTRTIQVARLLELRIGHFALRDQPVVVLSRSDAEPDVDGLLPLHVFERVSFRPRDGILVLSR